MTFYPQRQMYMGDILSPVRDDVQKWHNAPAKSKVTTNVDTGELQTIIKIQVYT